MWKYGIHRSSRALAFIGSLAIASVVFAQSGVGHDESIRQFADRAASGDVAAVRAMSKGRESEHVVVLLGLLEQARRAADEPVRIQRLRKSLAALAEPGARRAIAADLDSPNRYIHSDAFRDATEIGGNDMIVAVAAKLWDPTPMGRPVGPNGAISPDEAFLAPRHLAVIALSKLIADPGAPKIELNGILSRDEDVERWRIWWKANKTTYVAAGLQKQG
jgi:hypothetical protein